MRSPLRSLLLPFFVLFVSLPTVALQAQSPSNAEGTLLPPPPAQATVIRTIALNTPQTVASAAAGQMFEFSFNGTAGEVVSLAEASKAKPCAPLTFSILNPGGDTLSSYNGVCGSTSMSNVRLPVAGNYIVRVGLAPRSAATFTLTQSISRPITVDVPMTVSSTAAGQGFNLTFDGEAGQRESVIVTKNVYPCGAMSFMILKPDGSRLAKFAHTCGNASLDRENLPATGTYTIHVEPGAASGGATFTVSTAGR